MLAQVNVLECGHIHTLGMARCGLCNRCHGTCCSCPPGTVERFKKAIADAIKEGHRETEQTESHTNNNDYG